MRGIAPAGLDHAPAVAFAVVAIVGEELGAVVGGGQRSVADDDRVAAEEVLLGRIVFELFIAVLEARRVGDKRARQVVDDDEGRAAPRVVVAEEVRATDPRDLALGNPHVLHARKYTRTGDASEGGTWGYPYRG